VALIFCERQRWLGLVAYVVWWHLLPFSTLHATWLIGKEEKHFTLFVTRIICVTSKRVVTTEIWGQDLWDLARDVVQVATKQIL